MFEDHKNTKASFTALVGEKQGNVRFNAVLKYTGKSIHSMSLIEFQIEGSDNFRGTSAEGRQRRKFET